MQPHETLQLEWQLTGPGLLSRTVRLNGSPLHAGDGGAVPATPGTNVPIDYPIDVAAFSTSFVWLNPGGANPC